MKFGPTGLPIVRAMAHDAMNERQEMDKALATLKNYVDELKRSCSRRDCWGTYQL